ncbi:hypothetical protein [Novipirellula maiorica]|uniref:hypothetical protein n=1 Tax=Novipirellula maiorica TaxID=1265734 RepID=UPI0003477876|nr:hypothetical protein [Rhodopirellula maiorica]
MSTAIFLSLPLASSLFTLSTFKLDSISTTIRLLQIHSQERVDLRSQLMTDGEM